MPQSSIAAAPPPGIPANRILALPPFPAVARKLMLLLARPNFTIPEVSHLVRSDAVFSGEVLRLANSAMMGLRYEVISVMHAISVLGMDRLRNLVLTVAMRDFIRGGRQLAMLRLCWRHNLASALVAEAMSEACSIEKSDAYTAGLLHDLGRLALVAACPAEYAKVLLECSSQEDPDVLGCEERWLGMNHCQAGLLLADQWGLPGALREVLCLSLAARTGPFTVVRLASVACPTADRLGFSLGESQEEWDAEWLEQQLPHAAWQRLGPKAEALRESIPMKINVFECEFLPE